MNKLLRLLGLTILALLYLQTSFASTWVQGIYVTQSTLENSKFIHYLIQRSKAAGINTFVIELSRAPSIRYRNNIRLVLQNHIRYVVRIVVFPDGATSAQMHSLNYIEKKYALIIQAINIGASEVQLDYIRYRASMRRSAQNVHDVHKVIKWFKTRLDQHNIPLQIDVFGETTYLHSMHIGQNIRHFAESIDAVCPMLYPSHFEPYRKYSSMPYHTVLSSIKLLKAQFNGQPPFRIYPYIEVSNYRIPMSNAQKQTYIREQLRAVRDADVDGWFAWSPHNKYENLFAVLVSSRI